jgi:outer membrane lipoprotein-sorting protein
MCPDDKLEESIRNLRYPPDEKAAGRILQNVLQTWDTIPQQPPDAPRPPIWRQIMKTRLLRYAAAAAVVIAIGTVAFTLNHAQPAWAIEQTIQAMKDINAVYVSGRVIWGNGKSKSIKIWARPNKQRSTSGDYRSEIGEGEVIIANEKENATYQYKPTDNTVHINQGITSMIGPVFDSGTALRMIKDSVDDWMESYGTHSKTGKNCIFVKIKYPSESPSHCKSMLCVFDLETKLPIQIQGWATNDFSGEPNLDFDEFNYNPELPSGLFDFVVPEGAKFIDERVKESEGQR